MSLKRDKICPQCESRKLWHLQRLRLPIPHHQELTLAVTSKMNRWTGRWESHGEFESFICATCGFTEWYASGLDRLAEDPSEGVHFIDDEPKAGLR